MPPLHVAFFNSSFHSEGTATGQPLVGQPADWWVASPRQEARDISSAMFVYSKAARGLILDGWAGWYCAFH